MKFFASRIQASDINAGSADAIETFESIQDSRELATVGVAPV
ncbi:hypothetical protein RMSM_01575 [Rhodopirellula maiorica SM1]|uniref:Uncharacterized protein n=1 Tax=Rhodopirellula maiorica SM1 TaxID=1265738 RepID=M5S1G7_9BACT|nr:hypothetical protein [Rhodopirellula maiorica]EMI21502.1 hypothetical protein RMSM_01575 [Rhodopirellula maiorica SM1]